MTATHCGPTCPSRACPECVWQGGVGPGSFAPQQDSAPESVRKGVASDRLGAQLKTAPSGNWGPDRQDCKES